jgi:hypothetical protein
MRKHPNRILLLIVFWALNLSITTAQSDADKLRALFGEDCLTACFMGIRIGLSTLSEVESMLQQEDIAYVKNIYETISTIEWELPPHEFLTYGQELPIILVSFSNQVALKIIAPLNAPITAVIEVFGSPTYVTENRGRQTLTYPQYGITFVVESSVSTVETFAVYVDLPTNPNAEFVVLDGEPINQTCLSYGVPPCIIPTATPTPTLTPTAQPTSLTPEGQALYEVFSGQDCALDCFMGIKPNATTEQELIAWLDAQQIPYEIAPIRYTIDWLPPYPQFFPDARPVQTRIIDGKVAEIYGRISVPITTMAEVFGAPPLVIFSSGSEEDTRVTSIYFNYSDIGLGFRSRASSMIEVSTFSFSLSWAENPYSWPNSPDPYAKPMTDCAIYGVWPCIIPTATPTPTLTPTAQPTSLTPEGQALYEVFSGQDCALDCFMGIKPNVTTEQELIAWLDAQQIPYEIAPIRYTIDWLPPYPQFFPDARPVQTRIIDGKVAEIYGRISVPITTMAEVFGAPPLVIFSSSSEEDTRTNSIYLNYPELGLGFDTIAIPEIQGLTFSFSLSWAENPYSWPNSPYPYAKPMTDCAIYGVWPCIIPTATPTPTA